MDTPTPLQSARATLKAAHAALAQAENRDCDARAALIEANAIASMKAKDATDAANAEYESPVNDAAIHAEMRRDTEAVAAAAARAASSVQRQCESAARELAQAKRAVETAADGLLEAENALLADKAEWLLAELMQVGEKLHLPDEIHTPINKYHTREAKIARAIARLRATLVDDTHTPINKLASLRGSPEPEYRVRRRAELIAGMDPDAPPTDDATSEAA